MAVPTQKPAAQPAAAADMEQLIAGLMKHLNLDRATVMELLEKLKALKDPREAVELIKSYDQNPETMGQELPPALTTGNGAAPAAGTGIPLSRLTK